MGKAPCWGPFFWHTVPLVLSVPGDTLVSLFEEEIHLLGISAVQGAERLEVVFGLLGVGLLALELEFQLTDGGLVVHIAPCS